MLSSTGFCLGRTEVRLFALLSLFALLLAGCGGGSTNSTTPPPTTPTLTSLSVAAANATVVLGNSTQLTVKGNYSDGTTKDMSSSATWSSSATGVATVNSSGVVTTKAAGTAVISATVGSVSGSTTIVISPAELVSIAVTQSASSVPAGLTADFTATGTFTDGSSQTLSSVTWSSSDANLATASSTGTVTTHHQGAVTITATSGQITGSAPLTIASPVLASISVSGGSLFLGAATPLALVATGKYTDQSTADLSSSVSWKLNTPYVVSIDAAGTVTPKRTGYAEVTASIDNIASGPAPVSVLAHPRHAFVVTGFDRAISHASIDADTGQLHWKDYGPTGITNSASSCATLDPDSRFVYVGHSNSGQTNSGQVEIYTLNNVNGSLTPIPGSSFTVNAPIGCIEFEPSGKFGYAAAGYNNTNNQLVIFSRDTGTGRLTQINSIPLPSPPSTPVIDPTGHFLYIVATQAVVGTGAFAYGYTIDSSSGALTPIAGTPFQLPTGTAVFTFHPSGRYAYLSEGGSSIDTYSVDSTTGKLAFLGSVSTCINPSALKFSPSAGPSSTVFAYNSCSMDSNHTPNSGTLQGFAIAANGNLVPVNSIPANATDVYIDPAGSYLYTAGGNYIHEYRLDKSSGEITASSKIGAQTSIESLLLTGGISFVSYTPSYAFIASTGDNRITSYAIANNGTLSNPQSVASPLGPFSLSAVPWGDRLFAANRGPSPALTSYSISNSGVLAPVVTFGLSTATAGVVMDPSGRWALDLDPIGNVAHTYYPENTISWGPYTTGTTPGPMAIDGAGRFVFVGNQGSNSISVFEHWNTSMELFERTSTYTAPYTDGSPYALPASPLQISVAPDGSFLYVLCGDQTLRVFSIDYTAGAHLTSAGSAILGSAPTGLAVMPQNNLLYVADSTGVKGYSVDAATGALTLLPVGASAVLANANGVYAEPSGQFLYVTTSTAGGGAVYGYSVDASGQLTPVGAGPLVNSNQPSSMAFTALIQ